MTYPLALVDWLAGLLDARDWSPTIPEILDTEAQYPGLIDDVSTAMWQYALRREELEKGTE